MKTKKILATAGIGAIALVGTTVSADEVVENPTVATATKVATPVEIPAKVAEKSAPTTEEVTLAQTKADDTNKAVVAQQAVADSNKTALSEVQAQVVSAISNIESAKVLADQATPDTIAKVTTEVATAEQHVTTAEKAVQDAKSAEPVAEKALQEQTAVIEADQATVNSKSEDVAVTQKSVDTAQANLDSSGAKVVLDAQKEAQANFNQATKAVQQANTELDSAKQFDTQLGASITAKKAEVATADTKAKTAKTVSDTAQATADKASQTLKTATDAKVQADNAVAAINTIAITSDYVESLKIYQAAGSLSRYKQLTGKDVTYDEMYAIQDQAEATLKAVNAKNRDANNYKSNENDKKVVISDLNNLSEEVHTDLSLFASDLVNQIHAAFGTPATKVTKTSLAVSDAITDEYIRDNWSDLNAGHNNKGINRVKVGNVEGTSVGENMNSWSSAPKERTLDSLKRLIYNAMKDFMFNGREWMHATSVSGLDSPDKVYVAADISVYDNVTRVHLHDMRSSNGDSAIANPYDSAKLVATQKATDLAFNGARVANETAQAKLIEAKAVYTNAVNAHTKAQAELAQLEATPAKTATAQANLLAKQASLETAKSALDTANKAVANLNASIQEKQQALETAKAVLASKQAELGKAQATLTADEGKLQTLTNALNQAKQETAAKETELAKAQQSLAQIKNYLESLKNAPAILADAQAELVKAEAKLVSAKNALETELAKLAELEAVNADAAAQYNTVKKAYDDYMAAKAEEERLAKVAKDLETLKGQGIQPVPVYNDKGVLIGYTAPKAPQTEGKQTPIAVNYSAKQPNAKSVVNTNATELPSTGDVASTGLALVGGIMSVLGLAGASRKRK